ncbi:MAG: hypothetical protein K6G07_00165 [Lachnospiraceae bacterium]|nr:hypothetical protein [Lachnospiraceae bacterium]
MNKKNHDFVIEKGQLEELGVVRKGAGLTIVCGVGGRKEKGIEFTFSDGSVCRIPFDDTYRIGGLFSLYIPDFPKEEVTYRFFEDDAYVRDPYAKHIASGKRFADADIRRETVPAILPAAGTAAYDWSDDVMPMIPFEQTVIYRLHMRGFTKHSSAKVAHHGTFRGLTEKIDYLKDLGITAVETMPIYDFDDVIYNPNYAEPNQEILSFLDEGQKTWEHKTNYWGYTTADFFAPKRAYSSSEHADVECKDMIKALHKAGIEFFMQIYFPVGIRPGYILDVCRYWVREYHVDGFNLMGLTLPIELLATDPYLHCTKLIFEHIDEKTKEILKTVGNECRHLAVMSRGFLFDARKFLKGDEDMLSVMAEHFRYNPAELAVVNAITSYQGFTLEDLVSYDRKHNEDNGEQNRDGSDYNYSWNCGCEGACRRKNVLSLRDKQKKNALMMMFFSQGTPVLLAGDEFGNSAEGNNNPYCQDNAVSWLNWKSSASAREFTGFVKELIAFRKAHPILHLPEQPRQMDYASFGYPDLSYHGDQAWFPHFENYNRHMGIMYCGRYAKLADRSDDAYIYIAYNAHWIDHSFALPNLPAGFKWEPAMSSGPIEDKQIFHKVLEQKREEIVVPAKGKKKAVIKEVVEDMDFGPERFVGLPRSITVFVSVPGEPVAVKETQTEET